MEKLFKAIPLGAQDFTLCIPIIVQRVLGGVVDACYRLPHGIDVC